MGPNEKITEAKFVDSRPDISEHQDAQMSAASFPDLTAPEGGDAEPERGPLPPVEKETHMNAHPWVPPGRE